MHDLPAFQIIEFLSMLHSLVGLQIDNLLTLTGILSKGSGDWITITHISDFTLRQIFR